MSVPALHVWFPNLEVLSVRRQYGYWRMSTKLSERKQTPILEAVRSFVPYFSIPSPSLQIQRLDLELPDSLENPRNGQEVSRVPG